VEKQKCPEVRFKGFTLEWEEFKLENMFTFYRGESFSKSDIVKDGNFKCIHYGELFTKYNSVIDEVLSSTNLKGLNFGRIGDILMPSSDVTPDGLAKASCLKVDNVLLGGDINILRPVSLISSVFISYQINHSKEKILKCVTGTTVKHVYNKDLKELGYLITTFKEQTQIGNFFQNLDQSIALHEKKLSQTQNLKKAMLEKMFPKAGSTQPEIRLKGFSGDWDTINLGSLCYIGDIDHRMPESTTSGIPYLMTGDFFGINGLDFKNAKLISNQDYEQLSKKIKPVMGDILFARYASVGTVRLVVTDVKFLISYSCAILKTSVSSNGEYLFYWFQTSFAQNQIEQEINTGSQRNIGIDSLKKLSVSLPKTSEQKAIANFFKKLDGTLALQQQQLQTLNNLKQAFLEKMFV
jgi:type I restriction enzyme S subunit